MLVVGMILAMIVAGCADISAEDISRKICGLISDGNKRVTIKKNIEDIDFSKQNDKVIDDFYRVVDSL